MQELEPDNEVGPNYMSLNEYRSKYESGWCPKWLDGGDYQTES